MDKRFYGITMKDLKTFAFAFAQANKIEHCFNQVKQTASNTSKNNIDTTRAMCIRKNDWLL